MVNEKALIDVTLNSKEAEHQLQEMQNEMKRLIELKRKAEEAGDVQGWKKLDTEIKQVSRSANKLIAENRNLEQTLKNINGISLNELNKAQSILLGRVRSLTVGTKEWIAANNDLQKVKGRITEVNQQMGLMQSPLQKVIGFAKDMLPAFSFAAIAAGAKMAFDQVISSTDTLSTKWAVFMGGMKSATDEFFRTIATGDWSNFLYNMGEAVRVGREYQSVLDAIEERQRALSIAEADAREEIVKTEEDLRNKGLTGEQRLAAGKRRIQIEEELAKKRASLAKTNYENELMVAEQSSRLSKERLMQIAADFDSEKKIKAQQYNNIKEQLRLLEAEQAKSGAATGVLYPGMTSTTSAANPRIAQLKSQLSGFSSDVVDYAGSLSLLGNVTDEQMNKVVQAYSNMKDAEVSGRESIKRVITQVNNLMASGDSGGGGSSKSETDKTNYSALLEPATDDPISNYAIMQAEKEAEALEARKASQKEFTDFYKQKIEEQTQAALDALETEIEIAEARKEIKDAVLNATSELAGALSSMFKEGSAAQIAALAVEKGAAIARIIMNTFVANSKAKAMYGPLATPWVIINTATAAANIAQIAKTAVTDFKDKKNNDKPGFYSGGFTGYGSDAEVAGIVHRNEYVINAAKTRDPRVQQYIRAIESASPSSVSPPASGGAGVVAGGGGSVSNEVLAALANELAEFRKWKPKVYTELIKKDLDTLNEIDNKR